MGLKRFYCSDCSEYLIDHDPESQRRQPPIRGSRLVPLADVMTCIRRSGTVSSVMVSSATSWFVDFDVAATDCLVAIVVHDAAIGPDLDAEGVGVVVSAMIGKSDQGLGRPRNRPRCSPRPLRRSPTASRCRERSARTWRPTQVKIVMRADGKRMITDAARALLHPA